MPQAIDLKILPIVTRGGELRADHPGLQVAFPPRRSSRRRSQERLILHLELEGNAPLNLKAKQQLLEKLADVYFQAEGSTTSALRNVGDVLNKFLLDRNLRGASRGVRGVGVLTQIVVRDSRIVIAQSGSAHAYLVQPGQVEELYDVELSGPGLGVGRVPKIRYHQWDVEPGQLILTASTIPPSWKQTTFENLTRMSAEGKLNRLLHRAGQDLDAVLIEVQEGSGKIKVLRPMLDVEVQDEAPDPSADVDDPSRVPTQTGEVSGAEELTAAEPGVQPEGGRRPNLPADAPTGSEKIPPADPAHAGPAERRPGTEAPPEGELGGDSSPLPGTQLDHGMEKQPSGVPPWEQEPAPDQTAGRMEISETDPDSVRESQGDPAPDAKGPALPPESTFLEKVREFPLWGILRSLGTSLWNAVVEIWRNLAALLGRMMPNEEVLNLPPWVLGLIAVMVPLVMVTFGSVFYIKRGRDRLYTDAYQQAQFYLQEAAMAAEDGEHYRSLSSALEYIELARSYQSTEEIEELYQATREEVDLLDRITRLEYQPLFSRGLGSDVQIAELVVTSWNDLYILNEVDGTVLWAQSNADGYQIKRNFTCGPITGHKEIGPLVDIVAYAANQNDQAAVLGIDRSHTMIICYTDEDEPPVLFEDTSYSLGRGPVQAITLSTNPPENLYILDPEKRAIWIEYQSENYHEGSEYFGAVDSPPMADAVDLATNGSEMYLLHADGYLTKCVKETPTANPQCQTPFEFSDQRAGRESGPFVSGANFDSMQLKSAPGMALYLLDGDDLAVYRFSTQLELQKQFRPALGSIDGEAGAFAVTMSDRVFLGVKNQVYTAQLIP